MHCIQAKVNMMLMVLITNVILIGREKDNEDEEIATESSLTKRMNIDESLTKEQDKLVSASSDGAISSSDNRALGLFVTIASITFSISSRHLHL